jgi:hypothetical protein
MSRKTLPDLLKGIAVLLMIQVHLVELFARQDIYNSFFGKISLFLGGPPAAPVFMAVMGYFLASGKKGMMPMLYRCGKLLLWGLMLNIGLNLHLFYHVYEESIHINPLEYIFGVDILFLAGLGVMAIALIKQVFRNRYFLWMALAIILVLVSDLLPLSAVTNTGFKYPLAYLGGYYRWSYFPIIPWLAYPFIGYSFALVEDKIRQLWLNYRQIAVYALVPILILLFTLSWASGICHNLDLYYHHGFLFFTWTIAFMACWTLAWNYRSNTCNENLIFRYICWTGRNVTAFYIFQWLIIGNIATQVYKTQGKLSLVFWFLGITLVTSFLVLSWRKIRDSDKQENLL